VSDIQNLQEDTNTQSDKGNRGKSGRITTCIQSRKGNHGPDFWNKTVD
jgi:hypothetical protein